MRWFCAIFIAFSLMGCGKKSETEEIVVEGGAKVSVLGFWKVDYSTKEDGTRLPGNDRDYMQFEDGKSILSLYSSQAPYREKYEGKYKIAGNVLTFGEETTLSFRVQKVTDNPRTQGIDTLVLISTTSEKEKIVIYRISKEQADTIDRMVPLKYSNFQNYFSPDLFED